jgi:hypothetical protein
MAEQIATWRYRVEDLSDSLLEDFCERVGSTGDPLSIHSIHRNFNTRQEGRALHVIEEVFQRFGLNVPRTVRSCLKKPSRRSLVTWDSLEEADRKLCMRLKDKALEYGYSIEPTESQRVN